MSGGAGAAAACETGAQPPRPSDATTAKPKPCKEAAKPPEPPMKRARAASECWMKTEKGRGDENLDKRADVVTKCIDDKMKAVAAAPKT